MHGSTKLKFSAIYDLHKGLNIVSDIKIRRIGWEGHIIRMEDERIPINFLNEKFHNRRPAGKQRTRWEDVVRRDTSEIGGIGGWRR